MVSIAHNWEKVTIFRKMKSPFFVQILNIKKTHWITVSSLDCDCDVVNLYDSLYNGINLDTICQIASMIATESSNMILISVNIQRQSKSHDCGLFALVTATELA